jgi:CubicO group peptidase (beta-lactamase class C family)
VGHLGFTGTSFWLDLDSGVLVVLLTNRVHPSRQNTAIKAFRPRLHDWVMQKILQKGWN